MLGGVVVVASKLLMLTCDAGGWMVVKGVKLCTTSGVKCSLVRAFWMDCTGARETLLDCGGDAPSSLSLAISCLSDALVTLLRLIAVLKVLSDRWTEGEESPISSLCTWVHTR